MEIHLQIELLRKFKSAKKFKEGLPKETGKRMVCKNKNHLGLKLNHVPL